VQQGGAPHYAHPQSMKVLKHIVYIQYGCGMRSAEGGAMAPLHCLDSTLPQFSKLWPHNQCKGAPLRPSTSYGGAKHCIRIQSMWDVVGCSQLGLQPQPRQYRYFGFDLTPNFQTFLAPPPILLHRRTGVTRVWVHPYAHPMKVLKHFIHPIWMQSVT
jgi:hypothetical protein